MKEEVFRKRIEELLARINELPTNKRRPLHELVDETCERHEELKQSFRTIRKGLLES